MSAKTYRWLAGGLALIGLAASAPARELAHRIAPEWVASHDSGDWLNSPPRTPQDLKGKSNLIVFLKRNCKDCVPVLTQIQGWDARYRKAGLETMGVYVAPLQPVYNPMEPAARMAKRLRLRFPIVLDRDNHLWKSYGSPPFPTAFLLAPDRRIVSQTIGSGDEAATEGLIRELLKTPQPAP